MTPVELSKLRKAMMNSRKELGPFRLKAEEAVREYVGTHYGSGEGRRSPLNLVELAVNIYMQNLASGIPQVMVTSNYSELKPSSHELELALNFMSVDQEVGLKVQRCTRAAMFSPLSVMKVAKEELHVIDTPEGPISLGRPYCLDINFDDWVQDMSANRWDDLGFKGHRYRVPLEIAKNNEKWSEEARQALSSSIRINRGDEDSGGRRLEDLPRGYSGEYDDLYDLVEIWEIHLPYDNVLVTFPVDGAGLNHIPLIVEEWTGPPTGPHIPLSLGEVPNNVIGVPPVFNWLDLHGAVNDIYLKLVEEAKASKNLIVYDGTASDDAERIRRVEDNYFIRADHKDKIGQMKIGGVDNTNLAFVLNAMDQFSRMAGNLDTLGGLAAGAGTLGQEQLLTSTSSRRIQFLQQRVLNFTTEIFKSMGFMIWGDPTIDIPLVKRIPRPDGQGNIEIPFNYNSDSQEGEFIDHNIKIEPYSMVHQTPQQKAQQMMMVLQQATPHLPFMQQQGIGINYQSFYKRIAQLMNMEAELENIFTFAGPPDDKEPVGDTVRQAAVTERHNVRHNQGNQTSNNGNQQMVQQLLKQGGQQ